MVVWDHTVSGGSINWIKMVGKFTPFLLGTFPSFTSPESLYQESEDKPRALELSYQDINETFRQAIKMVMASIKDILVILKSLLGYPYVLYLPLFHCPHFQLCLVLFNLDLCWPESSKDAIRDKSLFCTYQTTISRSRDWQL